MPRVSTYRMAGHLATAFTIFTALVWTTLSVAVPISPTMAAGPEAAHAARLLSRWAHPLAAVIGITAMSGCFVAGKVRGRGPSWPAAAPLLSSFWRGCCLWQRAACRRFVAGEAVAASVCCPFTLPGGPVLLGTLIMRTPGGWAPSLTPAQGLRAQPQAASTRCVHSRWAAPQLGPTPCSVCVQDAGRAYNTWPDMNGEWFPSEYFSDRLPGEPGGCRPSTAVAAPCGATCGAPCGAPCRAPCRATCSGAAAATFRARVAGGPHLGGARQAEPGAEQARFPAHQQEGRQLTLEDAAAEGSGSTRTGGRVHRNRCRNRRRRRCPAPSLQPCATSLRTRRRCSSTTACWPTPPWPACSACGGTAASWRRCPRRHASRCTRWQQPLRARCAAPSCLPSFPSCGQPFLQTAFCRPAALARLPSSRCPCRTAAAGGPGHHHPADLRACGAGRGAPGGRHGTLHPHAGPAVHHQARTLPGHLPVGTFPWEGPQRRCTPAQAGAPRRSRRVRPLATAWHGLGFGTCWPSSQAFRVNPSSHVPSPCPPIARLPCSMLVAKYGNAATAAAVVGVGGTVVNMH